MLPYPPDPDAPIEAVCAATYYADQIPAFAFVFRVSASNTRFTVYASDQHRYRINETYTLTLFQPDHAPLWLSADGAAFLRHCCALNSEGVAFVGKALELMLCGR